MKFSEVLAKREIPTIGIHFFPIFWQPRHAPIPNGLEHIPTRNPGWGKVGGAGVGGCSLCVMVDVTSITHNIGGSRISQTGKKGAKPIIWPNFTENWMKMKKIGPGGDQIFTRSI